MKHSWKIGHFALENSFHPLKSPGNALEIVSKGKVGTLLVLPVLDYCDVVYDCLSVKDCQTLQRLQNYALRVILQSGFEIGTQNMHEILGLCHLSSRRHMHTLNYVYSCAHDLAPPNVCSQMTPVHETHQRNTRAAERYDLQLPNYHLDMSRRSFRYRGPFYWNFTDLDIRSKPSLPAFKTALYKSDMFGTWILDIWNGNIMCMPFPAHCAPYARIMPSAYIMEFIVPKS